VWGQFLWLSRLWTCAWHPVRVGFPPEATVATADAWRLLDAQPCGERGDQDSQDLGTARLAL
jgi:hypothetical protein